MYAQPLVLWFLVLFLARSLVAADWPADYVVQNNSGSPDGHYALLVRSRAAAVENDNGENNVVYLANIPEHRVVGQISGVDYFQGQNHADLQAHWAADSNWCAVQDDSRFGFNSVSILELNQKGFSQTKIGDQIQKPIDQAIAKQAHAAATAEVTPYFRTRPDRTLAVRAVATTNPKDFEDVKSYYARFAGTYDLKSHQWTFSTAHSIDREPCDALTNAYVDGFAKHMLVAPDPKAVPEDFTGSVFSSEEEKATDLDRTLNEVYQAVRLILAKKDFDSVKREQIAWLQKRDRAGSWEEKSKLIESRIYRLQDLLWKD